MRPLVIVFTRAPRLGTVKTRLAAGIGDRAALRFHTKTMAATLRKLRGDRRFAVRLLAIPARARGPWTQRLTRGHQVTGDLGRRMDYAFRAHPRRRVAVVGCDIPDLTAEHVARALHLLRGTDAVFGPATDGGYWLVALGARRPSEPFANVRWSGPHALADTTRNFKHRRVRYVTTLADIDEAADLRSGARAGAA